MANFFATIVALFLLGFMIYGAFWMLFNFRKMKDWMWACYQRTWSDSSDIMKVFGFKK